MRRLRGTRFPAAVIACLLAAALTGCAGPSTRVLPREVTAPSYEGPEKEEAAVLEAPNPFYLQEALDYLSLSPRVCGSEEERDAAEYLGGLLKDYGYQVELQEFAAGEASGGPGIMGINVTALMRAPAPDADILIVTAHHDTVLSSPGANESASGVVTMLESARLLARIPTDTELRFVSFGGSSAGRAGAQDYISRMSGEEKDRVIGVLSLDALGYAEDGSVAVGTMDGQATLLGDLVRNESENLPDGRWPYETRTVGCHSLFVDSQIPAAAVGQQAEAYESGTPQDRADVVDVEKLADVTEVLTRAAAGVMSSDTPSLLAKSRFTNDLRDGAFTQRKDTVAYFGQERWVTETGTGIVGELVSSNTDGAGDVVDTCRYRMKWFDVDQVILTDYHYLDGRLDTISLDADGAGVTFEDMKERISSWYGDPAGENLGPDGTEYDWADPVSRRFFALIPVSDGYEVEIREYSPEETVLGVYRTDGTAAEQLPEPGNGGAGGVQPDTRTAKLLDLVKRIMASVDSERIAAIRIFTDGVGGQSGYLEPATGDPTGDDDAQTTFLVSVDVDDALTPDGQWGNRTETVRMLTGFYGQILETAGAKTYADAFKKQFEASPDAKFSDAFRMFVLSQKPEQVRDTTDAQILFFYDQEELTGIRRQIRKNLDLSLQDGQPQEVQPSENGGLSPEQ